MNPSPIRFGIVSALQEEQAGLSALLQQPVTERIGMRDYTSGRLAGHDCVLVLSRIGKVAAAATVATLIERFGVTHVLFTGVAGSGDPAVAVGDIVIADALVQHDMDPRPLFPRYEVPLLGLQKFSSDVHLSDRLLLVARQFVDEGFDQAIEAGDRAAFRLQRPRVHAGLIASGDEFIHQAARMAALKSALPDVLAVEMEGAAVAQVCFEFGIPFAVMRTISDNANEASPVDFMRFIDRVAARYAFGILTGFFRQS